MDVEDSSQCSEVDEATPYQLSADVWMVPCVIDRKSNNFLPTLKPSADNLSERSPSKFAWTPQEDEVLRWVIADRGTKAWTAIAQELNVQMHQGTPVRHGKQCRERWYNHLDPGLRKGNWSALEDLTVLESQLTMGNRWSDISKMLPGRNENSVKNRWKSMVRKAQKELPPGTDVIMWLIADCKARSPTSSIEYMPPVMYSPPALQYQMNLLPLPPASVGGYQVVESVRRDLRNLEQPQQFAWAPYFQAQRNTGAPPSTFLAF